MNKAAPFLKAFKPKFKGEIWENARRFRLVGEGYKAMPREQEGYFDIRTANHLRGPLKALKDPNVRIVYIIGATQVMKSICGDIWVPHLIEHESESVLCLFEDDPKARQYVATRLMDTVKKHPVISEMISDVVQENGQGRHQVKNTEIKFANSRLLRVGGLNDGNVSSLSWRFIWVSEAWLHYSDGLLNKARKRTDRFPKNYKMLIESQAGWEKEDLHEAAKVAHRVPLTWACPYCGGRQTWEGSSAEDAEYQTIRPPDFMPITPISLPVNSDNWIAPLPGTMAGMRIPASGTSGIFLSLKDRAKQAKWECYHCGILIEDMPSLRMQISDSYDQDYTLPPERPGLPRRIPKEVCFTLPRESNITNLFSDGAFSYLDAKEAKSNGNEIKLQDWFMSERAVFYSLKLSQTKVAVIVETVQLDSLGHIPNEKFRSMEVDCQKDMVESLKQGKDLTGNFWVVIEARDKEGGTFTLHRGWATSWEELFGKVSISATGERVTLGGLRNKFSVPTRNVAIDGGNWLDIVKEKAAHYRTKERSLDGTGRMVWATWKIMVGDDKRGERWEDGIWRSYWRPKTYMVDVLEPDGKTWLKIAVQVTRWSNFAVKSILYKLRLCAPGQPKFVDLVGSKVDAKTAAKEKGDFAYENQMNGFLLGEDKNGRPKFIELHKEQHYPDCHAMGIVLAMMAGAIRGESAAGDTTGVAT